ncbi:M23 family metallopeptidase [Limnohabitans sp. Rim8]|uniref:M23 family metallopeptidase n=1 Tax=Limnohabitans sp. Rim8 TaxID=1100718 RepID=UPI0025CCB9BE|nr:M23 family metallopeptidase [Limnohabitans sp. Rim8]
MQLIWVAGPAAKVVTISITTRTVLMAVATVSAFLVVLGFVFNLIGLRVAVEYAPKWAHRMGGVTSHSEQQKIEADYRGKLDELDRQLSSVTDRLTQLERLKNQALGRLGLEKLLSFSPSVPVDGLLGRGGPMNLWSMWSVGDVTLKAQIDQSLQKAQRYDAAMRDMQNRWQKDLGRMDLLPTLLPISGDFAVTSGFGFRVDPMTRLPSRHEGIDFVAPVGTPVLSTAPGMVLRAEHAGAYGNVVDIEHVDGFVTRYAHLQAIHVQAGQVIAPQQTVGTLGNTGRSSGPHLHYEVIFNGRALHPVKALAAWGRS